MLIEAGKVIPASHKHEFPPAWSGDGNTHWHECTCGERADDAVHSGGIATCNSKAVCDVCGQPYGTVDKTNHSGGTEIKGYIEAAEFSAGYTGDTYCKGCGTLLEKGTAVPATHKHSFDSKWSTDDAIHWHECACGAKADAAGHTFTDATCTDPMTCTVCGMTSGEAAGHDYKDGKCQVCGEEDADYVPPEEPSDPIDPSDPADPDDPAGKDDSSGEQNKESGTDNDASPKTGDDRSTTIYWILLVAALLIMRRVFKNRRR